MTGIPGPVPRTEEATLGATPPDGGPRHPGPEQPAAATPDPASAAAPVLPQAATGRSAPPGPEDAEATPAPVVPRWALAVAALASAGVLSGMYYAFADNRCALRLGPTGYPYAYRMGHGCFLLVEGIWASEADWVQAVDGTWRRAPDLRRPDPD